MKKIMNDPADVVADALRGMAAAYPDTLRVHPDPAVIARADSPVRGKVAVVSGGGSGHEPLHGGFVGPGMLDAAVPGPVFTSPTPDAVQQAVAEVHGGAGVLFLVKNYTGDVLNFETAAELAGVDGVPVRSVVVDDDVAVRDSTNTAGRRGVAGTVLVEKIVGAAAAHGWGLDECARIAEKVVAGVRSMGLALTAPTVPHVGEPSFALADDEVELGVGIHGEPGRERVALEPAAETVRRLLGPILADLPFEAGEQVVLLTNSMGATPLIELYGAHGAVESALAERGVDVRRRLVGPYVTSLEMQGMSLSLLRVDEELLELWDAPVNTPTLRW